MTTYIVNIDSAFRDINKYQNPTDFSVSFQTNTTTDYQVQGSPFDFSNYTGTNNTTYNNFFNKCSIDPDYQNSNLNVINGKIQQIQRYNESTFILSGIAYGLYLTTQYGTIGNELQALSSTGFSINYSNTTLVSLTGINNLSPYLCSLTRSTNGSYTFNWCIYSNGNITINNANSPFLPTGVYGNAYSSISTCKISDRGGIYWFHDFNYTQFNINIINANSPVQNNIYSITSPSSDINAFCNIIVPFDVNGSPYYVNNSKWGYHICWSDLKLYNDPNYMRNGSFDIELDQAENIYITTNLSAYDEYMYGNTPYTSNNNMRLGLFNSTFGFVTYRSVTGATGSQTGVATGAGILTEYLLVSGISTGSITNSYTGAILMYESLPDSININYRSIVEFRTSTGASVANLTQSTRNGGISWANINSRTFLIGFPTQAVTTLSTGTTYTGKIWEIDPIANKVSFLAETAQLFNGSWHTNFILGTNIYFGARSFSSIIYIYKFDTTINTLTNLTTLTLPTTTYPVCVIDCIQSISDPNKLIFISPDTDANAIAGSSFQKLMTMWIMEYNITTNVLTLINSSIKIYGKTNTTFFIPYPNRLIYVVQYDVPPIVELYDVTDTTNPFLINSLNFKISTSCSYYTVIKAGITHYYLTTSQASEKCGIWNIDIPENAYLLYSDVSNNTYVNGGVVSTLAGPGSAVNYRNGNTLTKYGYYYGSTNVAIVNAKLTYKTRHSGSYNTKFYSSHYSINSSNNLILNQNNNYQKLFKLVINLIPYFIVVSNNTVEIYIPNTDIVILKKLQTFSLPSTLNTINMLQAFYYNNFIYIAICIPSQCDIYKTDLTFSNLTLISSIPKSSVNDVRVCSFYYTEFAVSPKFYITITEALGFTRKYLINNNDTISLLTSGTVAITVGRNYYGSVVYYIPLTNQYILTLSGVAISSPLNWSTTISYRNVDITNDLTFTIYSLYSSSQVGVAINTVWNETTVSNTRSSILNIGCIVGRNGGQIIDLTRPTAQKSYSNNAQSQFNFIIPPTTTRWFDTLKNSTYVSTISQSVTGANDNLNIIKYPPGVQFAVNQQIGFNVNLPGNSLQIENYQIGLKTILVSLIIPCATGPGSSYTGPNSLWTYEVSNPELSVLSQTGSQKNVTYTDLNVYGGGGVLHNILTDGTPNWLSVVGGSLNDSVVSSVVYNSSFVKDQINNLYVTGNWSRKVEFFQSYNGTGIQKNLIQYPTNKFTNNNDFYQCFIAKLSLNTGEWIWVQPLLGLNNSYIQKIKYNEIDNNILTCMYYYTPNLYLYEPQQSVIPTGSYSFSNPKNIIGYFSNTSVTNSSLVCINNNGQFVWSSSLFSNQANININVYNLDIDENTNDIFVSGTSNSTYIIGTDGQNSLIQPLYPQIQQITQLCSILYRYSSSGSYISSSYISFPLQTLGYNSLVKSFSDLNEIININQIFTNLLQTSLFNYNSDSTLGSLTSLINFTSNTICSNYSFYSLYFDPNNLEYSRINLYGFSGPTGALNSIPNNSSIFILGNQDDPLLNRNFIIRDSFYDFTYNILTIVLNQQIDLKNVIRNFNTINNITGSNNYYSANLSTTPLYDIGVYSSTGVSGNNITFTNLYAHPDNFDTTKDYYFIIPQIPTGSNTGTYTSIVPITNITYNTNSNQYTFTVDNINELKVPSPSGPLYGSYLDIVQKNYSAFYTLQFYPGAISGTQTYIVNLYDLILPYRQVRNNRYPGLNYISSYPYIYLVIYNANEEDNFDPSIINSTYDNNIDVPQFALFQIPTTNFSSGFDNFYLSTSSISTPKIRFTPYYFKLNFKITDDRGNVLYFDNIIKDTDPIFENGVVPEELLNITLRLGFTKI